MRGLGYLYLLGVCYTENIVAESVTDLHPVPDFRSSTGLFSSLRSEHKLKASGKHLFDASVYQTDSSTSSFHDMVRSLSGLVSDAKPTEFHHMLATLASEGRLMRLYTQNVDGIDTSLPPLETSVPLANKGPWPRTIQLHGGLEKMVCSKCSKLSIFEPALFNGPTPPLCTACVVTDEVRTAHAGKRSHGIGRLRPRIVLYNEHNPDEDAIGTVVSADLRARPDAVIVVGTSMKIPGVRRIVREMCGVVRGRKNGLAVWINRGPPPLGKEFEDCWDLIVEGDCDKVATHAKMKRWNDDGIDHKACTESEVESVKKRNDVEVVIESPGKKRFTDALLTPAASPRPKPKIILKFSALKSMKTLEKKPPSLGGDTCQVSKNKSGRPKSTGKKQLATKQPSKSSKPSTANITTSFRVTKPALSPKKKKNPKIFLDSENELCKAMSPLSPQAARNNGPLQASERLQFAKPLFPNLLNNPLVATPLPLGESGKLKRMSEEIISPTTTPTKMEGLLN